MKKITKALAVVLAGSLTMAALAQSSGRLGSPKGAPLDAVFTENKGQWDSRALFHANRPGLGYWVTRTGLKLDLYRNVEVKAAPSAGLEEPSEKETVAERQGHVVSLDFVGANGSAQSKGSQASAITSDFYVGARENHARGVKSFGEAYAMNVLPGVHLRSYLQEGQTRFDVVVMPGVDPSGVAYQVKGADSVRLAGPKVLAIETAEGEIRTADLFAYQMVGNRVIPVPAAFRLNGRTVGFDLGSYDPRLPLIIDPLVYGSYVGSDNVPGAGNGSETLNSVYADGTGSVYMVGFTNSATFPVTDGPYSISLSGGNDMFLARMRGDAYTWEYAAFVGGSGNDQAARVDLAESLGKLWIVGTSTSADFPGMNNAFTGGTEAVFTRFSVLPDRSIVPDFGSYLGTLGVTDFAVDSQGRALIAGTAPNATLTGLGFAPIAGGSEGANDGYLLRLNADGTTESRTIFGSTGNDTLTGIDVGEDDEIAVSLSITNAGNQDTGAGGAPIFATTPGVFPNGRLLRNNDLGLIKLDSSLGVVFSAILGGAAQDTSIDVAIDANGDLYSLGSTSSFDYPSTSGAFREEVLGDVVLTKIKGDGTEIRYSTGVGTNGGDGPVFASRVTVDSRGVAYVGGLASWRMPGLPPQQLAPGTSEAGQIITTPDAVDPTYNGGVETISDPRAAGEFSPTTEAYLLAFNAAGTQLLYGTYIGSDGDETFNDLFVDSVGAVWVAGNTRAVFDLNLPPNRKEDYDVQRTNQFQGHVTRNAFKFLPAFGDQDGFIVKYRINLPVLSNLTLNPNNVAGGLGAFSTATVTLAEPAPTGGVAVTLSVSDPSLASFDPINAAATTTVTVPAGATTATAQVFTRNVTTIETVDVRATLDNDFKETRLTINPWVSSISVIPGTAPGGNDITVRVNLFQAPTAAIQVGLTTTRPDLVTLPNPAVITIPAGSPTGQIVLPTAGVDVDSPVSFTASLLGVALTGSTTLTPAELASLAFTPNTTNGGQVVTGTLRLNGKAGSARTINLTQGAGVPGMLVNGNPLPTTITVPSQEREVSFDVTAPIPATSSSTTLDASDGTSGASGTLFLDAIDLVGIEVAPSADVTGGTVITGRVRLTSAAGPAGFSVDLASSNANAGTLSASTVNFLPGQFVSQPFTLTTNVVSADEVTTLTASRTGFTTRTLDVTVRAINMTLVMNPATVVGGLQDSVGTLTINPAAPAGGLTVTLASTSSSLSIPATVVIPAGSTTATFNAISSEVTAGETVTINAGAGPSLAASATVTVNPLTVTAAISPASVIGGFGNATVTVTIPAPVQATETLVLNLASNNSFGTVPATLTLNPGATSGTFTVTTTQVSSIQNATITVTTPGGNSATTSLEIRPVTAGLSINPDQVVGGEATAGTLSIDVAAPAGGMSFNVVSSNGAAIPTNPVVIPAGSTSINFEIDSVPVTANTGATITATNAAGVSAADTMTVLSPTEISITLDPDTLLGTGTSIATVTVRGNAAAGGHTFQVAIDQPGVAFAPATVTIPEGTNTTTFAINTAAVRDDINVGITVTNQNSTDTAFLLVLAPIPVSLTFSPLEVRGGQNAIGLVMIDGPAPAGGLVVDIFSDTPQFAESAVATVTIPAGATSATFVVNSKKVSRRVGAEFAAVTAFGDTFGILFVRP